MNSAWSWFLTLFGITGLYLAGKNNKLGWVIGLAVQVLWFAYAINTKQWGFLVSALIYSAVYGHNWWKWYRRDLEEKSTVEEQVS